MFRMKHAVAALLVLAISSIGSTEEFVKGRLLVKFKEGTSQAQADAVLKAHKGQSKGSIPGLNIQIVELPAQANERAEANLLKKRGEIEFAEPDYVYQSSLTPNDPQFGSQWHLSKISAPAAWDFTQGSSSVVIAILDSGVSGWHSDLANQMVPGWNFVNNNNDTSDVNGHGTMVAGVAAAATNNLTGIGGVGFNCKIMPLRISDASGMASSSAMASALQWAGDRGARVANISFPASNSATVRSAAQNFMNRGGVVAISSGNSGSFDSNADNPYVLTVSSTNSWDGMSGFSTVGNLIDVAAPGESILTTSSGGDYTWGSGTSFSAPVVAGVAGLMFSANPSLSGDQCYSLLRGSSDDLGSAGWDSNFGWGRVNAQRAVDAARNAVGQDLTAPTVNFSTPTQGSTLSGTATVFITASDNNAVDRVLFYAAGVLVGTKYSAPYTWAWDTTTVPDAAIYLEAVAFDPAGNKSTKSLTVNVRNTVDTTPPTVQITSPAGGTKVGVKANVSISASDNIKVTKVELYLDGQLVGTDTSTPFSFSLATKKWSSGSHTLTAKAYDAAGNSSTSAPVSISK